MRCVSDGYGGDAAGADGNVGAEEPSDDTQSPSGFVI